MLLVVIAFITPLASVTGIPIPMDDNVKRVENILNVAIKSKDKVNLLIDQVKSNTTLMAMIVDAGLYDDFEGNETLFNEGLELLEIAQSKYIGEDYSSALNYTLQALEIFRDVFRNVHVIVCKAGGCLEKENVIIAEGLIVAMNRSRERIEMIRKLGELPDNVKSLLSNAENYLDIDVAKSLLRQGNVSGVAHRLAEAEKLISEAFKLIKSKAEEKNAERINNFIAKLNETFENTLDKLEKSGVNVTEILDKLGFKSVMELREAKNNLVKNIHRYINLGQVKKAIDEINSMSNKLQEINMRMEQIKYKHEYTFNIGIEISIEKDVKKQFTTLYITIKNTGNATVIFPNSAYGIIVEKMINGIWTPFYMPISAQVLTSLKPGQSRPIILRINTVEGSYRIVLHGWCEGTMNPIVVYNEFTIP